MSRLLLSLALLLLCGDSLAGQTTTVEIFSSPQRLSGPYEGGGSSGVRLRHERALTTWFAGASYESRFGDDGYAANLALSRVISKRWYGFLGAFRSDVFFLPRYRFDGHAGYKFGADLQWVATGALAFSDAHDEHRDIGAGAGLIRYFGSGWVVEGGVLLNRSSPGDVLAQRQHFAVSWLKPQKRVLTGRANFGKEAYQLTGADELLVDFNSFEVGARWDEWVSGRWGVSVGIDYYKNPVYARTGTTVATFLRFGR